MVAGCFQNDLTALGDRTPHDSRHHRMVEYTRIIQGLVEGQSPLTLDGQFYGVKGLTLNPSVPPKLRPGILVSGSSPAGMAAAQEIGAIAVLYPAPPGQAEPELPAGSCSCGLKIGIVT